MPKTRLKTILLSLSIITALLFGGLCYYASTLISPKKIRELTLIQLEKSFPGSNVKLGEVSLDLGTSFVLKVESLDLSLKEGPTKEGHELFSVNNFKVYIPILAVLIGGGQLDILIEGPKINYYEFKKMSNWNKALTTKQKKSLKKKIKKSKVSSSPSIKNNAIKNKEDQSIAIPAFLAASGINFKIHNAKIRYKLKDKSFGKVNLKKLVINDLGLKRSSAFEIELSPEFNLGSGQKIISDMLMIGDFNLSEYLEKGEIKSVSLIKIKNTKVSKTSYKIPNININIKALIKKNGDINLITDLNYLIRNKVSSNISIEKSGILIKEIDTNLFLQDLLNISNLKNLPVDVIDSALRLKGKFNILNKSGMRPELNFNLSKKVKLKTEDFDIPLGLNGSYRGQSIRLYTDGSLLKGNLNGKIFANYNINKTYKDYSSLKPFLIDLVVDKVHFSEKMIQNLLYAKTTQKKEMSSAKENLAKSKDFKIKSQSQSQSQSQKNTKKGSSKSALLPSGTIKLAFKDILIGKEKLDANGVIKTANSSIITERFKFNFSKGSGSLNHSTLIKGEYLLNKFDFNLSNLNLSSLKMFLPPKTMKDIAGDFTGKVAGSVNASNTSMKYDISADVIAKNGELKGVNISDTVKGIVRSIPLLKKFSSKIKDYDVDGKFDKLKFKGNLKNKHYKISNAHFTGINNIVEIKGHGDIFPESKKKISSLLLTYKDNTKKVGPILQKKLGDKILPVRMKGIAFALKPDYKYTLKKVAKKAYKKKGKKIIKKQYKKVMNDKNKKKLKKMFKGLFK